VIARLAEQDLQDKKLTLLAFCLVVARERKINQSINQSINEPIVVTRQ
jgi:hypothetical protein